MKKQGFTLAEVLIAMGLIGVIAAMTLPTFVTNCRQQSNDAKFSSTAVDIENAIGSMIVTELADDYSGTAFYANKTKENLQKYIKVMASGSKADFYGDAATFQTGGTCRTNLTLTPKIIFELKNTSYFIIVDDSTAYIDVNGNAKPNCFNRDLYKVTITEDGLLERVDN